MKTITAKEIAEKIPMNVKSMEGPTKGRVIHFFAKLKTHENKFELVGRNADHTEQFRCIEPTRVFEVVE